MLSFGESTVAPDEVTPEVPSVLAFARPSLDHLFVAALPLSKAANGMPLDGNSDCLFGKPDGYRPSGMVQQKTAAVPKRQPPGLTTGSRTTGGRDCG